MRPVLCVNKETSTILFLEAVEVVGLHACGRNLCDSVIAMGDRHAAIDADVMLCVVRVKLV